MSKSNKSIVIIGSGISGLSAAAYLAKSGYDVTVLEKNEQAGGRAGKFETEGFLFDKGPSWYWMPDVFEKFYNDFGKSTSDFYELKRLSPSYRVFDKKGEGIDIPADLEGLKNLFERFEKGSAKKLVNFLEEAKFKYETGINDLVYKPGLSLTEFLDPRLLKGIFKMDVLTSMRKHIRNYVTHPFLVELLEFPVLFLGALPQDTPALYSLMNYADMKLGTWYPMGGMYKITEAFVKVATSQGATIMLNEEVIKIESENGIAKRVITKNNIYQPDIVIGAGDYHHIEQKLLEKQDRNYDEVYWSKRKMAPSALLYFIGVNKKISGLRHHNLFFDEDFRDHADEIYTKPSWPKKPLFYACVPSISDDTVAPKDHENLFLLIPVAPGLTDNEQTREKYFDILIGRLEKLTGENIKEHIVYKRSYAHSDFVSDYHAFKGNAYGLANTLGQTAILKPGMKNKKLRNMYFTGQLTVPGPGVPPAIISGNVVAALVNKEHKNQNS